MDENTLVSACTLTDEKGKEDFTCAQLWINIANNCHHIAVNQFLLSGYRKKTAQMKNVGPIMRIIQHVLINSNKYEFLSYTPKYDWVSSVPSDDAPIVLLAIQSGAVLVTSDSRLRAKLSSLSAREVRDLRVLPPKEAVPLSLTT